MTSTTVTIDNRYIIITMAVNRNGNEVVHAYGPYPTRWRAQQEAKKMEEDDLLYHRGEPPVRFWVRQISLDPQEVSGDEE